ncbi:hypothetical protein ACWDSL_25815 [Streptomyces sp. NPDC000941]
MTGEQLGEAAPVERADWLIALVGSLAAGVVQEHWNGSDLVQLASGIDLAGASLPSQGWMALRRPGWSVTILPGVHVPDRVVRIAQEQAGRVLRSAWWRAEVATALLSSWSADPARRTVAEWEALRAALPGGLVVGSGGSASSRRARAHRWCSRRSTSSSPLSNAAPKTPSATRC